MTKQARPIKLRNGNWGAAIQGTVKEDEIVTIHTKSGKEWDARVTKVVWSGERDGEPLSTVATESIERASTRSEVTEPSQEYEPPKKAEIDEDFVPEYLDDDIPF